MRPLHRTLGGALGLLPLLFIAACGNEPLAPAFGSGCLKGSLQPGDTLAGAFTASSCFLDQDFWSGDRVPYETYAVQLSQGKAYHLYLAAIPDTANGGVNGVDARLTLWGRSATGEPIPLAASDDQADGQNSELWFVAPVSGAFDLVASSYDFDELGGYQLTMNERPVLGTLDTAGTYTFALQPSPCWRHEATGAASDTAAISFLALHAAPGEGIKTTVTTTDFPPVWEQFGPGFDTYGAIYSETLYRTARGTGSNASMTMDQVGGQVTIAVGASTVDSTAGTFTITLARTPPAAPVAGGRGWTLTTAAAMPRRAAPIKQP